MKVHLDISDKLQKDSLHDFEITMSFKINGLCTKYSTAGSYTQVSMHDTLVLQCWISILLHETDFMCCFTEVLYS